MGGNFNSLTDVLKKTIFFFDSISVDEIVSHVHRKMLKDYTQAQVQEKVNLCLEQSPCFVKNKKGLWTLNLEGNRDNDKFYSYLLKKKRPVSIREVLRSGGNTRNKLKSKPLVAGEANLISDGRFIQLDNGHWGLTEWEIDAGQYSLKNLVIKAHKANPGGLSIQQVFEIVNGWKKTNVKVIEEIHKKFVFFESIGDGIWVYNPALQVAHEELMKKFIRSLNRVKGKWVNDRKRLEQKVEVLEKQLSEVNSAYRETAAALAEKIEDTRNYEHMAALMAEKDLLLTLRKKEIYRYKEQVSRLEKKADSILYQCRIWVKRARGYAEEINRIREALYKNQASLEALFTKLQQYKEKDRENKIKISELKESHANKTAQLQTEIVELRQSLEKTIESSKYQEKKFREETIALSNDLKSSLEHNEEIKKNLLFYQQENNRLKKQLSKTESYIKSPLVKAVIKIISLFARNRGTEVSCQD